MTETQSKKIIIAEDDQAVRDSLDRALRYEGYSVISVNNGSQALEESQISPPDLFILDVMMPVVDGLSVCRALRRNGDKTPVLILTAKHEVADRVAGLDAGADDYLVKPFSLDELLARIRALLRRLGDDTVPTRSVGNLTLEYGSRKVFREGKEVDLTKTEYDLLELLMRNANLVLTRERIYEAIWDYDFETNSKSLDVYIGYLRRKVDNNPETRLIHTIRGVGYCLREP
ncbi:MAG: response regulator transcription factor [Actinomycetota bacterium]|jgi:two-component system response regulator MprA|nr:DNA-binding response regulator [Actinomycetota bacterium]MCH2616434.1 response regulator transcription factor [Acidimicrobiales bacterium]MED5230318.1 response regulator transcription factor [Actinomycetota bacterium]MED5446488.1 response regulator transcription factor [Actinomycetota bacterium]|tara:strand:+ start:630 stop:1319 length:690 start_codon:yes stop_codon:yes gene_type:complete